MSKIYRHVPGGLDDYVGRAAAFLENAGCDRGRRSRISENAHFRLFFLSSIMALWHAESSPSNSPQPSFAAC